MMANRGKKQKTAAVEELDQFEADDALRAIEKLQELQDELEKVNEEAHEKILAIEQKNNEMREPVYKKRNEIISSIPDFWLTAFLNHPTLGNLLTEEDQKIFRYLDSLIVEDFKDPRKGYSITFNFNSNPYFENTKLSKTINFSDEGTMRSVGTTIDWKEGKGPGPADEINDDKKGNKRPLPLESFFNWFSHYNEDKPEMEQDLVADIIKEEIWPNPIDHLNNDDDEDDLEDDEDEDDEGGDDGEEDEEEDSSGDDGA